MKNYELCETCAYYDCDKDDIPCSSCYEGENYEENEEESIFSGGVK